MKKGLIGDITRLRVLFYPKDKLRFSVMFVLMLAGSMLEAVGIGVIPGFVAFLMQPASLARFTWLGDWTASLPETPTTQLMLWAALLLVGFMVVKSLFLAFVYYAQNRIVNGFRVRLSCRMFRAYQSAPYEWLLQRSSSELQRNILNDVFQVINGIIMPLLDLVMAFLMTLLIMVAMLVSTSPVTLLGAAIIGGGVVLVIRVFRKSLQRTGTVLREESKTIIQVDPAGFRRPGRLATHRLRSLSCRQVPPFHHPAGRDVDHPGVRSQSPRPWPSNWSRSRGCWRFS